MSKLSLPDLLADIVSVRRTCVLAPNMIPVLVDGAAYAVNVRSAPAPETGLSVEDFVLGYLALGWHHVPILDGAFGTAICINYAPLPSHWRDRAIALHRAFGPDLGPVRDYLRSTNFGLLIAETDDAEEIRRFGTPRRALIVQALALGLRMDDPDRMGLAEYVRLAEPTATDSEITEAAHAALDHAAAASVEVGPAIRSETFR